MKIKKLVSLVSTFAIVAVPVISFATDRTEENVTPRSSILYAQPERPHLRSSKKIYLEPEKSILEKGKLTYLLAVTEGYDNNTFLDTHRDKDVFAQSYFKASFVTPITEETVGSLDYEMMDLMYASESSLDVLKNGIRVGVDHKLTSDLTLSAAYRFDYFEYLNTKGADVNDSFMDNSLEFKLRQALPSKMFHSMTYDTLFRNYNERCIRSSATVATDKERNDWRNVLGYEIGKYLEKDLLKLRVEYFNNNSNETYLKYYDYNSYKLAGSLTHLFNSKTSGLLSYSRQYRDYNTRSLINDRFVKEFESTDLATAAVFYSLNKSLSFGINYTYRQNHSNEPIDNYSGSLFSLSTYYKF